MTAEILRYTAFPAGDRGGNPAGVVLDAHGMTDEEMLAAAAEVGFSETAFLFPSAPTGELTEGVRHRGPRTLLQSARGGAVLRSRHHRDRRRPRRAPRRRPPRPRDPRGAGAGADPLRARPAGGHTDQRRPVGPADGGRECSPDALAALGWSRDLLDDSLPPYVAFAGNHHPVLAVSSRQVLADLDYEYGALAALMSDHDWTTMQLVHRERPDLFHARNPFPPGGVVEDPATGAAAAALGGYLRALDLVPSSRRVTIRQGEDMGRPSLLLVDIPEQGGIDVTGSATRL